MPIVDDESDLELPQSCLAACDCERHDVNVNIRDLLISTQKNGSFVTFCAPMVRYSRLPFRLLSRRYGCDVAYSPMIMAESFAASPKARISEFSTCPADRPLVVQFAAHNSVELVNAARYVLPFADGIDVNCGCPQRWAMREGLGASMLSNPEKIREVAVGFRNAFPSSPSLTLSVKIRLLHSKERSIDLCRQLASISAIDYITIHGRNPDEKRTSDVPHWDIVDAVNSTVFEPLGMPIVANGAVRCRGDAEKVVELTRAAGVMSAEGLLRNPALFLKGKSASTPLECITNFITLTETHEMKFEQFQGHLAEMLLGSGLFTRSHLKGFHALRLKNDCIEWINSNISALPGP